MNYCLQAESYVVCMGVLMSDHNFLLIFNFVFVNVMNFIGPTKFVEIEFCKNENW
jgi:hypothetical protein